MSNLHPTKVQEYVVCSAEEGYSLYVWGKQQSSNSENKELRNTEYTHKDQI